MTKKRNAKTLDQLLTELGEDPEFISRAKKREAESSLQREALQRDEFSLVSDLAEAGVEVKSVFDLVNATDEYAEAIPVLIEHLSVPHHERIREGIIRALSVAEARGKAGATLASELTKSDLSTDSGEAWLLANALSVAADDSVFDELVRIAKRREVHHEVRAKLVESLSLMSDRWAVLNALIGFLDDEPSVVKQAITSLGKLGDPAATPYLTSFLAKGECPFAKDVRKALKRIEES